ncbi:MAG TPA: hypothetical protein VJU61_09095, partial [Polyangiaceae bacterium]|nr:hypothetical protein [Polyangiaceae bacterium]
MQTRFGLLLGAWRRLCRRFGFVLGAAVLLLGHFCCSSYRLPPLSPRVAALPARLSQAHLYRDASLRDLSRDLRAFAPAFELWSDGAEKRRWIRLPAGTAIDTAHMDSWVFPVGTELWKEFSEHGRRLETRLLTRVAEEEDGWVAVAYRWNAEGTDALALPEGEEDVLETGHDVPNARACMTCHAGRPERVLGFSALQLSHAPSSEDDWTLERLAREGLLTVPPKAPFAIPGNPTEVAALGYLHANCGACHNGARPDRPRYYRPPPELDLWLQVAALESPAATPTYRSALGEFVLPGDPQESPLFRRFAHPSLFRRRMPPLATEVIDPNGRRLLERWIQGLAAPS